MDNLFVPGSSTPVSERDADGDTFQIRKLDDGSSHRVLKNFPDAQELVSTIAPCAASSQHHQWQHFWALEYTLK